MGYLDTSGFINIYYALNTALETHFADIALNGDLNRVVYSKKDSCFRARVLQRENGGDTNLNKDKTASLDIPFMQYAITDIDISTSRGNYFNNIVNVEGIYVEDLGRKVKLTPVRVEYSLNIFYQRLDEALMTYTNLHTDNANETILYPEIYIDNDDGEATAVPFSCFLAYSNITLDGDKYSSSENDWLETNKLHVLTLDGMSFDTVALSTDGVDDVYLTDEFILNFLSTKEGYTGDSLTDIDDLDPQTLLTYYFDESYVDDDDE